jgi:type II secretory pathway predicted ATPase ExeA
MSAQDQLPSSRFGLVYEDVLPRDFNPGVNDRIASRERMARIEAERRVAMDKYMYGDLKANNPLYAEALQDWLEHEKKVLVESGVSIDDEMLAEAEILDQIIAEANDDQEDPEFIRLAEVMKDMRVAERQLDTLGQSRVA